MVNLKLERSVRDEEKMTKHPKRGYSGESENVQGERLGRREGTVVKTKIETETECAPRHTDATRQVGNIPADVTQVRYSHPPIDIGLHHQGGGMMKITDLAIGDMISDTTMMKGMSGPIHITASVRVPTVRMLVGREYRYDL